MYEVYCTRQAEKDLIKVTKSRHKEFCLKLIELLRQDPFKTPPVFKKIIDCKNTYSRRINIQHRLFYEVDELNKRVKILRMWTHYGDN